MSFSEAETSYRAFVQRFVKAEELSPDEYDALETYRSHLRLLPDQARAIEQSVLAQAMQSAAFTGLAATESREPVPDPVQVEADPTVILLPSAGLHPGVNLPHISEEGSPPPPGFLDPFATAPPTAATTVIPPQHPENYFAHLQQYGNEFLQALRAEGVLLSEETKSRLSKLAKQFELSGTDVAETERKMLVDLYLTSKPPDPAKPPDLVKPPDIVKPPEAKYGPQYKELFEDLEASLKVGKPEDLADADEKTFQILVTLINPSQGWLDEQSLKKFAPKSQEKQTIQEIDRLWSNYSQGRFGFSQQLQIYGFDNIPGQPADLDKQQSENRRLALAFSRRVKWWINGLELFKAYEQLDFTTAAAAGHLPALWFWEMPRVKAFSYGNLGLLRERGWCGIDAFTLPAFMYLLKICGIIPSSTGVATAQLPTSNEK